MTSSNTGLDDLTTASMADLQIKTWVLPIPGTSSFLFLFSVITALTYIVGTAASWIVNQPDVRRAYRSLSISRKRLRSLRRRLAEVNRKCTAAEHALNAAFVARVHDRNVLDARCGENRANTEALVGTYRNTNVTVRTDGEDPFHDVAVVHKTIIEDAVDQTGWSRPPYTTLTDKEVQTRSDEPEIQIVVERDWHTAKGTKKPSGNGHKKATLKRKK